MKRGKLKLAIGALTFMVCLFVATGVYAAGNNISDAAVTLSGTSYTYDGNYKKPGVKVVTSDTGTVLQPGVDYTVSYSNNKNAGTGTVTITAKEPYTGQITKNFVINPRDINSSKVKVSVSNVVVNKSFSRRVTFNGKRIYSGKSYTVIDSDVSSVGYKKGYITIQGIGNFEGIKTVRFTVHPRKVNGVKNVYRDTTSVKLAWNSQKSDGVTGYKVYLTDKNGENRKLYARVKTNECALVDLDPGEYKYVQIRSYKKDGKKYVNGDYTKVITTCARPKKAITSGVTNMKKKTAVRVYVKKQLCDGYEIQYSTTKDFSKGVKTLTKKSGYKSYKIELNGKKKYYFRTRAYNQYNNGRTKIYGSWSNWASNKYDHVYSSYTTYYSSSDYNRCQNLKVACRYINGTVLLPGESFDFNEVVGPRTKKKGFREAGIFKNGGHGTAVGGGICQVSTTMFNAALVGNMKIDKRYQHSQRVGYIPAGRDAAMYKKKKNLKFTNNTNYIIIIKASASGGRLRCRLVTCNSAKPKKVKIKVTKSKGKYTLRRYVDGKCNYKTTSKY